jgi:hypothetical protein
MKTIRHTICLSREQALEYRRYQINFSTWNWLPRSYDRTPLGCGEIFSLDGIEHAKALSVTERTYESTIEALVNQRNSKLSLSEGYILVTKSDVG